MQQRVLDLLEPSEPKQYALRVVAKIARSRAADYRISLQIDTGAHRAERVLRGTDCADLVEAAAWLIALTVDPELSSSGPENRRAPTAAPSTAQSTSDSAGAARAAADPAQARRDAATTDGSRQTQVEAGDDAQKHGVDAHGTAREQSQTESPPADTPAEKRPTPEVAGPPSPPWPHSFRAGANAGVITGDGASAQAALGAFVGYGVGALYTQLRVHGSLPREVDVTPPGRVRLWALASELSECALFGGALRMGPCLGVSLLRSAAHLEGLATPRDRAYVWAAAIAGLQLFWLLPRHVELSLAAAARVPLSKRPRYVVEGLGTVVSAQSWAADLRLGVGFALR
jgi:hypothetical protein